MKTVGIYVGPWSNREWDESDVENGMSGSETWAIEISKEFVKHGYEVFLYAIPHDEHDIVENLHFLNFMNFKNDCSYMRYDYFISSRFSDVFQYPYLRCDNCYIMVHDNIINTPSSLPSFIGLGKIKGIFYLSDWHRDYLKLHHKSSGINFIPMYKVSNGFSNQYYQNIDLDNKENSMIWSSSLARGFELFVENVLDKIMKRHPDFQLYACSGTNYEYDIQLKNKFSNVRDNIHILQTLSKRELADFQKRSKVWVYPGTFQETFCITAVEQCAAGNVAITPLSFGLKTTLKDIEYLNHFNLPILTEENSQIYADFVCRMLEDNNLRKIFATECINAANKFSWTRACEEIIDIFNQTDINMINRE